MKLCVIPARGGSKRIPRKNIKSFCGKPMIAYAIEAAKKTSLFDYVIVSTEDEEVASISRDFGAEVPFVRPETLADDHTATVDVIAQAIIEVENLGWNVGFVCCIYPCVPLLQSKDLAAAFELLQNTQDADYSFPITKFPSAVQRGLRLQESNLLTSFYPEYEQMRTQDFESAFYDAGQFYWGYRNSWLQNKKIHNSSAGLVIASWRVVDIDTPEDWERAELLFRAFQSMENR